MYILYIYERWEKRPDQKGKQSIPSAGNQCRFRQGRLGATNKTCWPQLGSQPTDFRFDRWKMFRAACRTRSGGRKYKKRANTALFTPTYFYVGSFFPPLICICIHTFLYLCVLKTLYVHVHMLTETSDQSNRVTIDSARPEANGRRQARRAWLECNHKMCA